MACGEVWQEERWRSVGVYVYCFMCMWPNCQTLAEPTLLSNAIPLLFPVFDQISPSCTETRLGYVVSWNWGPLRWMGSVVYASGVSTITVTSSQPHGWLVYSFFWKLSPRCGLDSFVVCSCILQYNDAQKMGGRKSLWIIPKTIDVYWAK